MSASKKRSAAKRASRKTASSAKASRDSKSGRFILFPTEQSTIGRKKHRERCHRRATATIFVALMSPVEYQRNVFINCPFDDEYAPVFEAIVFAVHDAGFRPKSAREKLDSSQIRVQKIASLISESRYSIHDLSRTNLDATNQLPRFNMPFELGMDVGCKTYSANHADKSFLIFESKKYEFQNTSPIFPDRTFSITRMIHNLR